MTHTLPQLQGASLGQRIRAAYVRAGFNRAQFARTLDVDYTTVFSWEKDRKRPNLENLRRVSELTGFGIEEILGEPLVSGEVRNATQDAVERFLASPEGARVTESEATALKRLRIEGLEPDVELIRAVWTALRLRAPAQGAE